MSPLEKLRSYIQNPIESIACTLSGGILVYGLLILVGVFFGLFHSAIGSPDSVLYTFGVLYSLSGGYFLWSYVRGSIKAGSKLLYVFICYLTIFLARITQSFYPITWLAPLICAIAVGILYIWMSVNARG